MRCLSIPLKWIIACNHMCMVVFTACEGWREHNNCLYIPASNAGYRICYSADSYHVFPHSLEVFFTTWWSIYSEVGISVGMWRTIQTKLVHRKYKLVVLTILLLQCMQDTTGMASLCRMLLKYRQLPDSYMLKPCAVDLQAFKTFLQHPAFQQ